MIITQLLSTIATPPKVYATWNPNDKGPGIVLSGNNLTARNTTGDALVRSTIAK